MSNTCLVILKDMNFDSINEGGNEGKSEGKVESKGKDKRRR